MYIHVTQIYGKYLLVIMNIDIISSILTIKISGKTDIMERQSSMDVAIDLYGIIIKSSERNLGPLC